MIFKWIIALERTMHPLIYTSMHILHKNALISVIAYSWAVWVSSPLIFWARLIPWKLVWGKKASFIYGWQRGRFHGSDRGRCHRPMQAAAAHPGIVSNVIASAARAPYLVGDEFPARTSTSRIPKATFWRGIYFIFVKIN